MPSKTRKRLSLQKETLRTLSPSALDQVAGGFVKTDRRGACSYSQHADANTICNDSGGYVGTDGCPSGVYSGCPGVC